MRNLTEQEVTALTNVKSMEEILIEKLTDVKQSETVDNIVTSRAICLVHLYQTYDCIKIDGSWYLFQKCAYCKRIRSIRA